MIQGVSNGNFACRHMKLVVEEDDLLLTQSRLVGLKEFFIGTGQVRINKLAGFLKNKDYR